VNELYRGGYVMWKKVLPIIISLVVIIILYACFSPKKINQIENINYNDITKIQFVDGSGRNKPLIVEDRQKIAEFIGYIEDCVVIKSSNPYKTGWTRAAAFYEDDKVVMDITFDTPIIINGKYYRVIWGSLNMKKIDKFLQSVDSAWTMWK
jgi:hypothetical protein